MAMRHEYRYLAYGSNLVPHGLARYVGAVADDAVGAHVEVPGWHLRFQGHSTRWDGSPATISSDPSAVLIGRAWTLDRASLVGVVAGEAGTTMARATTAVDAVSDEVKTDAQASHWASPVTRPVSQYDTVVAIDHPDGALWAVTSSTPDVLRRRCEPYLAQVHLGLTQLVGNDRATAEVEAALARSAQPPPDPAG